MEKENKINDNISFLFEQVHDFNNRYIILFNSKEIENNQITLVLNDDKLKETYSKTFEVFYIEDFKAYCIKDDNIYDLKLIAQNFMTFEIEFQTIKIKNDKYNLYLNM